MNLGNVRWVLPVAIVLLIKRLVDERITLSKLKGGSTRAAPLVVHHPGWAAGNGTEAKQKTKGNNSGPLVESMQELGLDTVSKSGKYPKFFIIPTPEITTNITDKDMDHAVSYYEKSLNEESAEIWLHRGLERLSYARTNDPNKADVYLIAGYLHLSPLSNADDYAKHLLKTRLYNTTKPHVFLCPTWNPTTGRKAGIAHLIRQFMLAGVNTWSVGFERNSFWQVLEPERIIPIPYVVRPSFSKQELLEKTRSKRTDNFVFYAGDERKHAWEWSGCNRSMVSPLSTVSNMDVSIRTKGNRLSQEEYNSRMFTSDYCLILCGDTVTSRSLASAMVYGCIPIRVGSRLRGLCESPCHKGWGWTITGEQCPHLPFAHTIDWQEYPEVNEANFFEAPLATLEQLFRTVTPEKKISIREEMNKVQMGWIYGWGDPVTSNEFGDAADYVWQSIVSTLKL